MREDDVGEQSKSLFRCSLAGLAMLNPLAAWANRPCFDVGEFISIGPDATDDARAIQECTQLIEAGGLSNPDLASAYNVRAIAYSHTGQTDLAIQNYTAGLQLYPQEPALLSNRGKLYEGIGLYDKALADVNLAMQGMPNDADLYIERGTIHDGMRQYPQAILDYTSAYRLDNSDDFSLPTTGMAHRGKGEYAAAILYFSAQLDLKPGDADALGERGDCYNHTGQYDLAIADFNQAIALTPLDAYNYTCRAESNVGKGEYALALQDNDQAIQVYESHHYTVPAAWPWSSRCRTRAMAGDLDGALSDCNLALSIQADQVEGLTNRGLVYLKQQQYQQAVDDFNAALAKDSTQLIARYGLGTAKNHLAAGSGDADIAAAQGADPGLAARFSAWGFNGP